MLEFDQPYATDTVADRVYSQPNFTSNSNGGVSPTALYLPTGLALDGLGNLYVADSGNNRVLEYNSPLVNSAANLAIGTGGSLFSSNACLPRTAPSATSLCVFIALKQIQMVGLAVDQSENLYVADNYNDRVLEYNQPVGTGNTTANRVFGTCGSFTSNSCASGDDRVLGGTLGLAFDNSGDLYISSLGLRR